MRLRGLVFLVVGLGVLGLPAGASAEAGCANEAVRVEQASTRLPDCRAYELVAPEHQGFPSPAGPVGSIPNQGVWIQGQSDRIAYPSADPFVGPSGLANTYLSTRGSGGWSAVSLYNNWPQAHIPFQVTTEGLAEDASKSILTTSASLDPADTNNTEDVYLRDSAGTVTWVSQAATPNGALYAGRSADASHVFYTSAKNIGPEATGSAYKLYEWFNGTTRLVGIDPDGTVDPGGSSLGTPEVSINAVSSDGASRVFFEAPLLEAATPADPVRVYVRLNGTHTVEVSKSQCTRLDCDAPQNVAYAGATPDGSKVFVRTNQQLTNDDVDSVSDLYSYDLNTDTLTRLSPNVSVAIESLGSVLIGSSDDGERAYFQTADQTLALWDHGHLMAIQASSSPGAPPACEESPEVTPDGRVLVFTGQGPDGSGIYRYDAASNQLILLAPSGVLATVGLSPPVQKDCHLAHVVSDDGSTVFFSTEASLVPQDVNGLPDVYEWHNGSDSLISTGTASLGARVLGTTADARDVFFITTDSLVSADHDEIYDIYDARVGGGFTSGAKLATCEGDGCQSPPVSVAASLSPPSSFLHSTGNLVQGPQASFSLHGLTARQGASLARGRSVKLLVNVNQAGKVTAKARSKIGGKTRIVASASSSAPRAGTVSVALRLSQDALRQLAIRHRLRITLAVRVTGVVAPQTLILSLKHPSSTAR